MNTDQLIEGIGRAVELAKPAPELCMGVFGCMTKSEWAAWAQAVFSVIGILIAVAIPYIQAAIQKRSEDKKEAKLLLDNYRRSYGDFSLYSTLFKNLLDGIAKSTSIHDANAHLKVFVENFDLRLPDEKETVLYELAGDKDEGYLFAEAIRSIVKLRGDLTKSIKTYEASNNPTADITNLKGLQTFACLQITSVLRVFEMRLKMVNEIMSTDVVDRT